MQYCERCLVPYDPLRVRSGDYHFRFCCALCQSNADVIFERDILTAERKPAALPQLTEEEQEELRKYINREGPLVG